MKWQTSMYTCEQTWNSELVWILSSRTSHVSQWHKSIFISLFNKAFQTLSKYRILAFKNHLTMAVRRKVSFPKDKVVVFFNRLMVVVFPWACLCNSTFKMPYTYLKDKLDALGQINSNFAAFFKSQFSVIKKLLKCQNNLGWLRADLQGKKSHMSLFRLEGMVTLDQNSPTLPIPSLNLFWACFPSTA